MIHSSISRRLQVRHSVILAVRLGPATSGPPQAFYKAAFESVAGADFGSCGLRLHSLEIQKRHAPQRSVVGSMATGRDTPRVAVVGDPVGSIRRKRVLSKAYRFGACPYTPSLYT